MWAPVLLPWMMGLAVAATAPAELGPDLPRATEALSPTDRLQLAKELEAWKASPAGQDAERMGLRRYQQNHRGANDELTRFLRAKHDVQQLRLDQPKAKFDVSTPFALLTLEEFKAYVARGNVQEHHQRMESDSRTLPLDWDHHKPLHSNEGRQLAETTPALPSDVDWRTSGCVGSIRNQGECGVCWIFASVAALESGYCINKGGNNNALIELSEQYLVSCGYRAGTCWGGFADESYKWIANSNGGKMCTLASFPFTSLLENVTIEHCRPCEMVDLGVVSYAGSAFPNHEDLERVVAQRPVAADVFSGVSAFKYYKGGVLLGNEGCSSDSTDHVVEIIGYGQEPDGTKFWRIKNSWGTRWGEEGFMKLERGYQGNTMGACGIEGYSFYPVFRNEVPWLTDLTCSPEREGIEIVGKSLKTVNVKLFEQCCDACRREPGCKAVTWRRDEWERCQLLSTVEGERYDPESSSMLVHAKDSTPTPAPSPGQCILEENVDYYNGGMCYMKSAKGKFERKNPLPDGTPYFVSGLVDRNPPTPTPTPTPSPTTDQCLAVEENTDYVGNDVGNAPAKSVSDCCGLCTKNAQCNAYTWTKFNGGTCFMKRAKGSKIEKKNPLPDGSSYFTSGEIKRESPTPAPTKDQKCLPVEDNVDYFGNDITAGVAARTVGDCCSRCTENPQCGAYTWSTYNGGVCYLKSHKGKVEGKNPGWDGAPAFGSGEVYRCQPLQAGTDFPGEDVANVPAARAEDCCAKCRQRNDCSAFSWSNHQKGTCWLKRHAVESKAVQGVISARV